MTDGPGFDPYEELGVGEDADAIVIQLAYKARIRETHPDIAGAAGLARAKRLNIARDWLLDPGLRAQLLYRWQAPSEARPGRARGRPRPGPGARPHDRPGAGRAHAATDIDPFTLDLGPCSLHLRAFFGSIRGLAPHQRARVNYSLGETRPVFFDGYRDYLGPQLWARSRLLRDVVSMLWHEGVDEDAPFVFPLGRVVPSGFLVANAYAQWILLGDFLRQELGDAVFRSEHVLDAFARRCTEPWEASVGQSRYGPYEPRVLAFLEAAPSLSIAAAERLAHSWLRHLGRDGLGNPSDHIGPGVWLPAPPDYPEVLKVSGYLAAVDASRIPPPEGLEGQLHDSYRYGLRLTAHVLALGLADAAGARDYLRPWRDALGADRSAWQRLRGLAARG